jgi:hypothetical protein
MTDWVLEMLVKIVDAAEKQGPDRGGLQITLCVGGVLISGQVISSKLYFQMFADGIIHDVVEKAVASGKIPKPDAGDTPQDESPEFIHLASAKFLLGGHNPIPTSAHGVLWRCKLNRVDGFHLGEFRVSNEDTVV